MKRILLLSFLCLFEVVAVSQQALSRPGPVKVEIVRRDSSYIMLRGGSPYFVKGAGGSRYPDRIAAYGGNSIRTWGSNNGDRVLDTAQKYGLTVLMGLDVARERHGFNYDDTAAVRKQFDRIRNEVMKYKDHPALLAWGIGNELNLQYKNPQVWNAVNDIAKMIHQLDPFHPVCTVLAGINASLVTSIKERCPALDFLSINTYGGLASLPATLQTVGWRGPYMVTEWGPTGHWESAQTEWKSAVEETSSEKAAVYRRRYESAILKDKSRCLGSYVFLWGQKQERTPTWYGVFTDRGEESEVVDVMQYLWSGRWPANRAPHLSDFVLDGKKSTANVYLNQGKVYEARCTASDPDGDKITYRWEVLPEPTQLSTGGDFEASPKPEEGIVTATNGDGSAKVQVPNKPGAYRLFVYVYDGHNNVATANVPFYVK